MEARELTDKQKQIYESYKQLVFSKLNTSLVQDLLNLKYENYIGRKYDVESIVKMLENPAQLTNQQQLRQMSMYLYLVSAHYRRAIHYFAELPTLNYYITPLKKDSKDMSSAKIKKFKQAYIDTINDFQKYNLHDEVPKMLLLALIEGAFYGLVFEDENSFFVRPFHVDYAKIQYIEDGCYRFAIDLNYFSNKEYLFNAYGKKKKKAYYKYKGKNGKKGDKKLRWYIPENGFCIKCDPDPTVTLPFFCGMFKEVLDLEDYRLLAKAKTELDNYKVIHLKQETDADGIPKMDYKLAKKYYDEAAGNISDGIGLMMTPFSISEVNFEKANVADSDSVTKAEDNLWTTMGTSPLLFGSTEATSSSALILSTKPDECISFYLLSQVERNFNRIQKLKSRAYPFAIRFLQQSIFNQKDFTDMYSKAAQYGVSGAKSMYAASIGLSPSDVWNMSFLEDQVLGMTVNMFNKPMRSTYTTGYSADNRSAGGYYTVDKLGRRHWVRGGSGGGDDGESQLTHPGAEVRTGGVDPNNTGGRPTAEERGETLSESGEASRDSDQ